MNNPNLDEEENKYRNILKNDPNNISVLANLGKVLSEKVSNTVYKCLKYVYC